MHPLAIVPELQAGITDEQRAEWLAGNPVDWANESFAIARQPEVGYCFMVDSTCQYAADTAEFKESEPERVVVVDDVYLDRHASIARERIADGRGAIGRTHRSGAGGSEPRNADLLGRTFARHRLGQLLGHDLPNSR